MRFIAIVALAVAAGIAYGILHDQVTARVCLEYFTIGHPPLIPSQSPTLLAIAWGIVATWWFSYFALDATSASSSLDAKKKFVRW
jgi:hypothetical protein